MHSLYGVDAAKPQLSALAFVLATFALSGCSDDPHLRTSVATTDPCAVTPGQMPRADCGAADVASTNASTSAASCELSPSCGDVRTCMPLARNQGKTAMDFRLRQLSVVAPQAFREGPVQTALVQNRVDLDRRQCGEDGTGLWNWLLRVDREAGTLTTGGAPPADPIAQGYCFAKFATPRGLTVDSARAPITWNGTAFSTTTPMDMRLPVFHTSDASNASVLLIHDARFADVSLSTEDCIGSFNARALDATCTAQNGNKWSSGGALAGYMTLEEADDIVLPDLSEESLCVVLLGAGARDDACGKQLRAVASPRASQRHALTASEDACARSTIFYKATRPCSRE